MLHRLVGRAIFADCDGVVGPHVQVRNLHEGGQTHGGTLVIGEHEEGAAVRTGVGASRMPLVMVPMVNSRTPKWS